MRKKRDRDGEERRGQSEISGCLTECGSDVERAVSPCRRGATDRIWNETRHSLWRAWHVPAFDGNGQAMFTAEITALCTRLKSRGAPRSAATDLRESAVSSVK